MKKFISILLVLCVIMALSACGAETQSEELVVFAAASMTESLTDIKELFNEEYPNVNITYNFDSSGTLKTQIEEGAICDVFIAASQKPMDNLNCVLDDSRFDILENKIALVVPEGNPKNIQSFDEMISLLHNGDIMLAIGNSDVPVGEYTLKIFDYYEVTENELNDKGCLTYGSNVKEVTTQVSEGMVDCGIVYQTDANAAGLEVVDAATEVMCGQVIYPAAIIETSQNIDLSNIYLEFLKSESASKVFEKYGFTPLT